MYRGRTFLVLHAPLIELEAEVAGECGVAETERVGESHRRNLLQARPFSDQDGKGFLLADPVDGYDRRAIKRRTVVSRGGMCLVMIYMADASCRQIQAVPDQIFWKELPLLNPVRARLSQMRETFASRSKRGTDKPVKLQCRVLMKHGAVDGVRIKATVPETEFQRERRNVCDRRGDLEWLLRTNVLILRKSGR